MARIQYQVKTEPVVAGPETVHVQWWQQLSLPVRRNPAGMAHLHPAWVYGAPIPFSYWWRDFDPPVRRNPANLPHLRPFLAFVPFIPVPPPNVAEWWRPFSEPVRLRRASSFWPAGNFPYPYPGITPSLVSAISIMRDTPVAARGAISAANIALQEPLI